MLLVIWRKIVKEHQRAVNLLQYITTYNALLLLSLLLLLFSCCTYGVDVTLVNETPVVRSDMITYMKCVSDLEMGYEPFSRVIDTGHGRRMTSESLVGSISPESWPGKRLSFFVAGGDERLGVFSCEVRDPSTNIVTSIEAIKISSQANMWPKQFTVTASVGDKNVPLVFESFEFGLTVEWEFNGQKLHGQTSLERDISEVTLRDEGIYECFQSDFNRNPGNHASLKLIVRACPAGKWNADTCDHDCTCINGGQCDAYTGECVCPPGFMGTNCEDGCGGNRFGQECQYHCLEGGSNEGADAEECKGRQFCLKDPYGCSCSAGFSGVECNDGCGRGQYGAGCLQTCHCKREDLCDRFTGSCTMGCATGWMGPSCQSRCTDGTWGDNCDQTCNCQYDAACDPETGSCPQDLCAYPYTGSNCQTDSLDECESSPCQNGGTCMDQVLMYECKCAEGTDGDHCQTDLDDCESSPCMNGATCTDAGILKFDCECARGYEGDTCDIDIDDCVNHKCENEAVCIDKVADYQCQCKEGFTGVLCQDVTLIPPEMMIPVMAGGGVVALGLIGGIAFGIYRFATRGSRTQLVHIGGPYGRSAW